jgi:hypothetical protein
MYILWAVLFVFAAGLMSYAQSYKMIITMIDGESIVIPADLVDNVSYIKSEVYSISWSLDNVHSSTDIESISDGMPFKATLTPTDGYYISSCSIQMGNDDVSTYYSNGKILIPKVSGNIVIKAIALKISDGIDLSATGTSNCYIVSDSGIYKFYVSDYVGTTAFVMWNELGADDITDVELKGDYVYFTKKTNRKGNALISLKDSNGGIVWSWHIWSTDEPQFIVVNGVKWMDRNLGATDVKPGTDDVYGLLYNPGNPNPFPGAKYENFSITSTPSVPDGWYVADGYGFYSSTEMPGPDKPMQLCTNSDKFGNSVYFRVRYSQVPLGCVLPTSSTMQDMMGYEPSIEDGGVYVTDQLFIPCNSQSVDYGKYLCTGIYNSAAVDTYTFYFYDGNSKSSNYCQGAARLPIRFYKSN